MILYQITLIAHVIAGTLALLSGPIAMMRQDGGNLHRLAGKTFFRSMMIIAATGLGMAWYRSSLFLVLIGVFSFYITFTGYRALSLKNLHYGVKAGWQDWTALVVCGIFGIFQLITGGYNLFQGDSFGIVSLVFGTIFTLRIVSDFRRFTYNNGERKSWLYVHIGNMMGAYIAAVTAFLVQNVQIEPAFIVWIAPTILITPFITFTIRKFRRGKLIPADN